MSKRAALIAAVVALALAAFVMIRGGSAPPAPAALDAATSPEAAAPAPYLPSRREQHDDSDGPPSQVERILFTMRGRFKMCYVAATAAQPGIAGEAVFTLTIGGDGGVVDVAQFSDGGLPINLLSCVQNALRTAAFEPPPDGGTVSLNVPVNFRPSRPAPPPVDAAAR